MPAWNNDNLNKLRWNDDFDYFRTTGTGTSSIISRRKLVFRFFGALLPKEVPIVLSILFRPVFRFRSANKMSINISENEKEKLLLSFFEWLLCSGEGDRSFNRWSLRSRISYSDNKELLMGRWEIDGYVTELPLFELLQRPNSLSGSLMSLELVTSSMRHTTSSFVPFFGQFLVSVIGQFHPVLEMESRGELSQLQNQLEVTTNEGSIDCIRSSCLKYAIIVCSRSQFVQLTRQSS